MYTLHICKYCVTINMIILAYGSSSSVDDRKKSDASHERPRGHTPEQVKFKSEAHAHRSKSGEVSVPIKICV
jgi:hypothetical protein